MKRKKWVDVIKGITIYLMVLGHTLQYYSSGEGNIYTNKLFLIIYSFHMPLFFVVSGYLMDSFAKRYTFIEGIKRKIFTILVPCLSWGCINFIIWIIKGSRSISIVEGIKFLARGNWFLWALFYSSVVVLIATKATKVHPSIQPFLYWIIVALNFVIPDNGNIIGYKMMFPFMIFGLWIAKYNIPEKFGILKWKNKGVIAAISLCVYVVVFFYIINAETVSIWKCCIINDIGVFFRVLSRWVSAFAGCMLCLFAVWIVANRIPIVFSELGKNSLGIYMVSTALLNIPFLVEPFKISLLTGNHLIEWFCYFVISVISTGIAYLITKMIKKNTLLSSILLGVKI